MKTIAVVLLFLLLSPPGFAQGAAKKEMKKEDRHHHLKSFACDESCGFAVHSQDESEMTNMIQMHAKKGCACCQDMSDEDVKAMIKEGKGEKKEEKKTMKKEGKEEMKSAKKEAEKGMPEDSVDPKDDD